MASDLSGFFPGQVSYLPPDAALTPQDQNSGSAQAAKGATVDTGQGPLDTTDTPNQLDQSMRLLQEILNVLRGAPGNATGYGPSTTINSAGAPETAAIASTNAVPGTPLQLDANQRAALQLAIVTVIMEVMRALGMDVPASLAQPGTAAADAPVVADAGASVAGETGAPDSQAARLLGAPVKRTIEFSRNGIVGPSANMSMDHAAPGIGGRRITVPPDVAHQIFNAPSEAEAKRILRRWLEGQNGANEPRELVNAIMGSNIRSGRNKNRESGKLFDAILQMGVAGIRSATAKADPDELAARQELEMELLEENDFIIDDVIVEEDDSPVFDDSVTMEFDEDDLPRKTSEVARLGSPLTLDTDGDGQYTSKRVVDFDLDGDGKLDRINDVDDGDLLLVWDADGDGKAGENGKELFGDNSAIDVDGDGKVDRFRDGFEALIALARREGLIGDRDNQLSEKDLALLQEKFGFALRKGGLNGIDLTFAQAGLTELDVGEGPVKTEYNIEGSTNAVSTRQGAGFKLDDGTQGDMVDVWFDMNVTRHMRG